MLLEALFLVLGFSLRTFLMMLFVILPSMLMILFPALSVVSILIRGNGKNWLVNVNLTYEMVRTRAGKRLSILVLEKLSLFHLTVQVIVLMWKRMGLSLMKNNFQNVGMILNWIRAHRLLLLIKLKVNCNFQLL